MRKQRIESETAPPSTGFRSQGLIAGGILFTGGQIGAEEPGPGMTREDLCEDMGEAVQITLKHLEQVTLATELTKADVFEVSAFPKESGKKDLILKETRAFLGFEPKLFNFHEVYDVAAHALIEMDWMAAFQSEISLAQAAEVIRPLGNGPTGEMIESGPFLIWNGLCGFGADLGEASEAFLTDISKRLEEAGGSIDDLVKLTVYLHAFDPYPLFNDTTKRWFADIIPPTRSVLVAPGVTGEAKICVDVLALKA